MKVGFIGIGKMGAPMATNVADAGFELTVFDKMAEHAETLAEKGAYVASDPAEVSQRSEVVITMLNDAPMVKDALLGEKGVLSGETLPGTVIDMSTVGPTAVRELAGMAEEVGVDLLDAPVSGSVTLAQSADLTTMVGGSREAFEGVEPVLEAMTKERVYLGPSGAGAAMKLAVNSLLAIVNQGVAEALIMAEKAGVEREQAYDVIASGAAGTPYMQYKRSQFLEPDALVTFTTAQMQKDLSLALDLARDLNLPAPLVAAASQMLAATSGFEKPDGDFADVADVLRVLSGSESLAREASGERV